jgi:hypothetical protein
MLRALAGSVERRQSVRRQSERLCHKPGELVAQTLDRREVPQISGLEPGHVLLFWPLNEEVKGVIQFLSAMRYRQSSTISRGTARTLRENVPYHNIPLPMSDGHADAPETGPKDAHTPGRQASTHCRTASQYRTARAGPLCLWSSRRRGGSTRGSAGSSPCVAHPCAPAGDQRRGVGTRSLHRKEYWPRGCALSRGSQHR